MTASVFPRVAQIQKRRRVRGMAGTDRPASPHGPAEETGTRAAPAHRDTDETVARAEADEAAADRARERLRTQPMAPLEQDASVAPLLGSDEWILAVRRSVFLDRRLPPPGSQASGGVAGDLYVTSRRLLLIGRLTLSFPFDEIEQTMLSGERVLLSMRDGRGASIDASEPRLLRVEIAAARASTRR